MPFLRGALNGGYPQFPVSIGSCVGGDSGEKMGVIGGANGKEITDWLASHTDHRVLIPLYNCRGGNGPGADGGCPCQKPGSCQGGYDVGGFACIEIMSWQKSYDVPRQTGELEETGDRGHRGENPVRLHDALWSEGRHPRPGRHPDPGAGALIAGFFVKLSTRGTLTAMLTHRSTRQSPVACPS